MAALQNYPISAQSKTPPLPLLPTKLLNSPKPLTLSFLSTFPSFNLTSKTLNHVTRRGARVRMSSTAAGSYALALAEVAKSNNTLEPTSSDVEKLEKLFSDPEVVGFFSNPTIDPEKKRQVVDELAQTSALQPHTANFLNILVDSKRIDLINDIVREFEAVYNEMTETELAVVSSVVKLESQHLAQIAKQVQKLTGAKNVRIKTVADPSLVAGFTVRYGSSGSKLIDMSVKKQLEEISAQLEIGDIQLVQ